MGRQEERVRACKPKVENVTFLLAQDTEFATVLFGLQRVLAEVKAARQLLFGPEAIPGAEPQFLLLRTARHSLASHQAAEPLRKILHLTRRSRYLVATRTPEPAVKETPQSTTDTAQMITAALLRSSPPRLCFEALRCGFASKLYAAALVRSSTPQLWFEALRCGFAA